MEPKFRTSFIPRQAMVPVKGATRGGGGNILFLITFILFLAAVALSAGVFFYQQFLEQSIESKRAQLDRAREAFEPALIEELSRLDLRIDSARTLLDQHVVQSELFVFLEQNTLRSVQFEDFNYSVAPDGRVSLTMRGRARSFGAVALQSDVFGKSRFIRDPIFSDLNLDQVGNVIFKFSAFVDPTLISYRAALERVNSEVTP